MHGSKAFLASYLEGLQAAGLPASVEVAIFPPFVYLFQAAEGLKALNATLGAQNVSAEKEGAFTGEISAAMLTDSGCRYVLVGHSERRTLCGESDGDVADKFNAAAEQGLTPVLCVGESLAEREAGQTLDVVSRQVQAVIEKAGLRAVSKAVVAYEPVWAIGTGRTATPEQAQEVHANLRGILGDAGAQTRILYGGSVKAANAGDLFSQPDIDGGLVGGASLDVKEFIAICRKAERL